MLVSYKDSPSYHLDRHYLNILLLRNTMSTAAQQIVASHTETETEDVDMLASPGLPAPNGNNSTSFATQCMAFQARIDSVRPSPVCYILRHRLI